MRPSLSPFEYGAYGTPSTRASVVVGGPHISSEGRDPTIEESEIGMPKFCGSSFVVPSRQNDKILGNLISSDALCSEWLA